MKTSHDVLKNMIRTEKGTNMLPQNKYVFRVDKRANKVEIRKAVEEIYKVKVKSVNVMNVNGKKKRVRYHIGNTPSWKKVIVTLKPDNRIEVT
ncbi:MAG: 50S ribosomal protein L23 [Candidatus Omnitrophica bacterium]|nr:50S ribosomal protein L23 [Candidatus Omnitrophota bacterium]MDD5487396.1 50S ribosomal protein L23 [Candidatus Omnitrophota bacterium]